MCLERRVGDDSELVSLIMILYVVDERDHRRRYVFLIIFFTYNFISIIITMRYGTRRELQVSAVVDV